MRLTAKAIREVQFKETFRGYERGEVDDFLDLAEADYKEFEAKLADANQRVQQAEARRAPAESETDDDNTDELRRTLILAQRTADAAIREAREEASRMVSEAEARTSRQLSEADAEAERMVSDADSRARQLVSDTERDTGQRRAEAHDRLMAEINALEGSREQLRAEMELLDRHVEEQRQHLRSALGELQRLLEDPQGLRLAPAAPPRDITVPDFDQEPVPAADEAPQPAPGNGTDQPEAGSATTGDETGDDDRGAHDAPTAVAGAAAANGRAAGPEPLPPSVGDEAEEEWQSLRESEPEPDSESDDSPVVDLSTEKEGEEAGQPTGGPPTQAVPELVGDADEDAFLAELRKAMTDDEPLGPRDEHAQHSGSRAWSEEPARSRPRFGRRR